MFIYVVWTQSRRGQPWPQQKDITLQTKGHNRAVDLKTESTTERAECKNKDIHNIQS